MYMRKQGIKPENMYVLTSSADSGVGAPGPPMPLSST